MGEEIKRSEDELNKALKEARDAIFRFDSTYYENGVVFAFGRIYDELDFAFDKIEFKGDSPDAIATKNGKKIRIEFEVHSSDFRKHGHDVNSCDLIICWRHDWSECPSSIEVLELSKLGYNHFKKI